MNRKKTIAIICAVVAVVAAFALLLGSGFGFIPLLRGAQQAPEQGADMQPGVYLQTDVRFVMDICAVERTASGEAVAYYAVSPMGNTFIMIRFPAAEYENVLTMQQATDDYLKGINGMDVHLTVTGTAISLSAEVKGYLEKWFEDNAEQMSQSGLIAAVEDYSVYLSDVGIESGMVGGVRQVRVMTAVILSVAALVLLLLAVALFILSGVGAFDKKEQKTTAVPAAVQAEVPAPEEAPSSEETPEEAPAVAETEADGEEAMDDAEEEESDTESEDEGDDA